MSSGVKVAGAWRQSALVSVKVGGVWRTASQSFVKVNGVWKQSTLAGPPAAPVLTYGPGEKQFVIQNYDAAKTYTLSGCTRSGNLLTASVDNATVKVSYTASTPQSVASTMKLAAHTRVLTTVHSTPSSTGCGPRPDVCCEGGSIYAPDGHTCENRGTQGDFCGGACPGDCFGLFATCWNWYWTDYTSAGYTLIGNTWGRADNG